MTDILALVAAVASAIATGFAAYAAWRAPRAAAELAESLRRDAEAASERKRQKFWIFATIMQERAAMYTESAVRALNMIDTVFHDVRSVREAWAELYICFNSGPAMQGAAHEDKLRRLLTAMAGDIGLGNQLGQADVSRVYFPNALQQERIIRDLERKQTLERLQGNESPSANTSPQAIQIFPPAPT